jgi:hypothetical protein
VRRNRLLDEPGEARCELRRRLIAVLLCVAGVSPDVGDQEGAQLRSARRADGFPALPTSGDTGVGHELTRGPIAVVGVLRHAAGEHKVELRRQVRPKSAHGRRCVLEVGEDDCDVRVALERRAPCQ